VSYSIVALRPFERNIKRLNRKYPSLKADLGELIASLSDQPHQGISLGIDFYKIRLAIRSKGKGKSGGARVVTCVVAIRQKVLLVAIYDKSEMESIDDTTLLELRELVDTALREG
jgi:hypothetical protein